MSIRFSIGFALLGATLVTASVVGSRRSIPIERPTAIPSVSVEKSPIDRLDRLVQRRLHENPGFGMSRLVDSPLHLHGFDPESAEESETLADLEESGWTVGLLLRGRYRLGPGTIEPIDERSISRPIAVTGKELPSDMPKIRDLRSIGRAALAASKTADSATATLGRWSVEARIVRADRESCVDCHSRDGDPGSSPKEGLVGDPLKIGDALGVVIYVYSRDRRAD